MAGRSEMLEDLHGYLQSYLPLRSQRYGLQNVRRRGLGWTNDVDKREIIDV